MQVCAPYTTRSRSEFDSGVCVVVASVEQQFERLIVRDTREAVETARQGGAEVSDQVETRIEMGREVRGRVCSDA